MTQALNDSPHLLVLVALLAYLALNLFFARKG